jgi:hypothetical protein
MTKTEKSNPSAIELKVFGKLAQKKLTFSSPPITLGIIAKSGSGQKTKPALLAIP